MGLKELVWPWGALKRAQTEAKAHNGRWLMAEKWGAAQTRTINDLRLQVAVSSELLAKAYFRDPNTGRFLDQGVLPPPKKEVIPA